MGTKKYLDADTLLADSFKLAKNIYEDGFFPTFIMAIWRGGAPIGLAVQEYFSFKDVQTDHILIRTISYSGIDTQHRDVKIFGLDYLVKNLSNEDRVLIVDDVYDTGRTIESVIHAMSENLKLNMPEQIKVAVPYYKPTRNKTERTPEYFIHETDEWLIYPHSIEGLTPDEIKQNKPEIYNILKEHLK
tara:strand:+ start:394 stop:957 length:564 start_codon:yes stop_codon:yes gene_type:complete